jgi:hypothetical protein
MKASNLIIAGGLVCCLLSNIGTVTAFLLINPSSIGKTIITRDSYHSSTVLFSTPTENNNNRRRQFLVSSIITAPILMGRGAWADEPNNIYYKSKADEEDPLAVFGRSLSQSKTYITNDDNDEGSNNKGVDGSKKELKETSFSPPPQADLTKALQEKSQQRRIDPRTHG